MKYILTIILLTSPEFLWAAPAKNVLKIKTGIGDEYLEKNIMKGNWEVGGSGYLGYSSFSGIGIGINIYGRYFLADHISLGLRAGHYNSEIHRRLLLGPSFNWHFLELNRWTFNFGQDVFYADEKYSYIPSYSGRSNDWRGTTRLGANYFINSSVYLRISLEYDYSLNGKNNGDGLDGLTSKIGFNVAF